MLQVGFFIFFNLLAFGFLLYGMKGRKEMLGGVLFIFSMVLFFIIGFLIIEEDIGTSINHVDNFGLNITSTSIWIAQAETFYLIYIYWGMALLAFLAFMFTRGTGSKM